MNEHKIMEYWESQPRRGEGSDTAIKGFAETPECGDSVRLFIEVDNYFITDVKYEAKGCVLSQAGASMLSEYLVGKQTGEANQLTPEDMLAMFEGRPLPNRLGCCLLPLRALKNAML